MTGFEKAKSTILGAPTGALVGGVLGILVAKHFGYDRTLMVVSFTVVGAIIGASVNSKL